MAVRRLYRVSDLGRVGPVEGLDDSTVLQVSASVEISWPGGHLDLGSDDDINVDVLVAGEIRSAFAGTSLSEIQVFDSLDVPDSAAFKECAVQVLMAAGPSWESATLREVDTATSFELLIRVLAPAERAALVAARSILRAAVAAVVAR